MSDPRWLRRLVGGLVACSLAPTAWAGNGPWTLAEDDLSLWFGAGHTQWEHFVGGQGPAGGSKLPAGEGVSRTELQGQLAYGVLPFAEVQIGIGWGFAVVARPDADACGTLGLEACDESQGLLPLEARVKLLLMDEITGLPFSLSVAPIVRIGDFTRPFRGRLTSLGEGTTDVGVGLSLGRVAALGRGFVSGFVDGDMMYRFPITEVDGRSLPAPELRWNAEILVGPASSVAVGFVMDSLIRFGGQDWEEVDITDVDRFTILQAQNLKLGGKLVVRSARNVSVAASVMKTAWAVNNPSDDSVVSVGIGVFIPAKR